MNNLNIMNILATVNFYAEEDNIGDGSSWAFWVFMMAVAGMVLMVAAGVNFMTVWRDFRIFYDAGAVEEKPDLRDKKRKMVIFGALFIVGIILFVAPVIIFKVVLG